MNPSTRSPIISFLLRGSKLVASLSNDSSESGGKCVDGFVIVRTSIFPVGKKGSPSEQVVTRRLSGAEAEQWISEAKSF